MTDNGLLGCAGVSRQGDLPVIIGTADIQRPAECVRKHWPASQSRMPPLTDAMRAVIRNENDVYGDEDALYAALCNAASELLPAAPPASRTVPNKDHILNIARECGIEAGIKVGFDDLYRFTEKILQA